MKKYILPLLLLAACTQVKAQKLFTRNAEISFSSKTNAETIEAENKQVLAIVNVPTKEVALNVLIKGFLFPKQLMQDHFNEEVLESDKFPKASFTGVIKDNIDLSKPGNYNVTISGKMTMHGVTKPMDIPAKLAVSAGQVVGNTTFKVNYSDFAIKLPALLNKTVSPSINVVVNMTLKPMTK